MGPRGRALANYASEESDLGYGALRARFPSSRGLGLSVERAVANERVSDG